MFHIKHLIPKILYETTSNYNKEIKVVRVGNTIKLVVNGMVQSINGASPLAKKRVWGKLIDSIMQEKAEMKSMLLLGMGAGTMLHLINNKLGEGAPKITSVEIDKEIVKVAADFFDHGSMTNNKTIIADAFDVISNPDEFNVVNNFDCIIVDTYSGDIYPESIGTSDFHNLLFDFARPDCLIVFNRVFKKSDRAGLTSFKDALTLFMHQLTIKKIETPGFSDNYLFYGYKKQSSY